MLFRIRKYISVFALAAFLFPIVTEELHAFSHADDFHCTEKSTTHFHKAEHHCPICDFVPAVSDKPFQSVQILSDAIYTIVSFSFYQSIVAEKHDYNFSLRAPPTIS
jgi:hypothetical protein